MSKSLVILRADGNSTIGWGHVMRCIALADHLQNFFSCTFLIQESSSEITSYIIDRGYTVVTLPITNEYDSEAVSIAHAYLTGKEIVVLDGYHFDTTYQQNIRAKGSKIVFIDDLHSFHFIADAVINHAGGINEKLYSIEFYTRLYLGFDYLVLRKPFLEAAKMGPVNAPPDKVFVCMGGADTGNMLLEMLKLCESSGWVKKCIIVSGTGTKDSEKLSQFISQTKLEVERHINISPDQVAALMSQCGTGICSASTVALEYLCTSGNLFIVKTADNQKDIYQYLLTNSYARRYDDFPGKKQYKTELKNKIPIDGHSDERLRGIFTNLEKALLLWQRPPHKEDAMLYFNWANDPMVRQNAINKNYITLDTHLNWFSRKLIDSNTFMLLFGIDNHPIGQVRFEIEKDKAVIDYSIDASRRGQGWGYIVLKEGILQLLDKGFGVSTIIGKVKSSNLSSIKVFEKLRFRLAETETLEGDTFKVFTLNIKNANNYR